VTSLRMTVIIDSRNFLDFRKEFLTKLLEILKKVMDTTELDFRRHSRLSLCQLEGAYKTLTTAKSMKIGSVAIV